MLAIGLAIAVVGWVADTQTKVESDVTKLVPQSLPALADLQALQKSTSVGGQIDVLVRSDQLTAPATLNWMAAYQAAAAQALRLQRQARLRQGRAVPGVLAARPLRRR